jgi:excisionase family DNA binding protein
MAATKPIKRTKKSTVPSDRELARMAADALAGFNAGGKPVKLTLNGKLTVLVPESTLKAMSKACATDAEEEMTTQEAADYLNVSRPYLIRLLDEGKIPYRLVGAHRRITQHDVKDYRDREAKRRRAILDELIEDGQELGLYRLD